MACTPQATPTVAVGEMPSAPIAAQGTPAPQADPVESSNFDSARAFEHVRKLAVDIGKRVAGTPGSVSAADYIEAEFEASGLTVTRQPFTFQGWEDNGTTVRLVSPVEAELDAQPIIYSPGGQVEADVVLVPNLGNRDDFSKVNVRGKIALVKRGTLPFSVKASNAAEAGAAAILIYNDRPQSFSGSLRDHVSIPTLGMSGVEAEKILDQLKTGSVRIAIDSDAGLQERTGHNVIGILEGQTDETIVLGGHYDSVPAGPGAGDNASGTAVVIELARALASRSEPPKQTLVFIAFDAEELGLFGSQAYVKALSDQDLSRIRAMLNFDMLGAGGGPLLLMGDGNVALLGRSSAQQLGITAHNGQLPANAGSDHQSFAQRGVDTIFFMRDYDLLHTPEDTIDEVQVEFLDEAGRVAERLIERMEATAAQKSSSALPTE
jgi:Zn-dependent M28 family amino/carboxypeptidase